MSSKEKLQDIKILILCGGKGERLSPLTDKIPKPLIPINQTPILTHLINYFEGHGFNRFVIAAGYRSKKIIEFFKENHNHLHIEIIESGDVDIINRIQDAVLLISGDFIMCYGDTLADVDLKGMIQFQHSHQGLMTITVYPLQSSFGILDIESSGKVSSFLEKPILDKWINIGYFYFDRRCLDLFSKNQNFVAFLEQQIAEGEMYAFKHMGIHITVNTITELIEAEKNIHRFQKLMEH
jgi:glucose-1-phosphate cytidylyltransferase